MPHFPSFEQFRELARTHTVVPVYRRLTGDTLTPVSAFCKIQEGDWSFLFESVVGGERVGRYSFLGAGPFMTFVARDKRVAVVDHHTNDGQEFTCDDPLKLLEETIARYRAPHLPGLPRFCGGAVGYAGYDTVRYVEKLPNAPPDDRNLPDLCFGFYDRMVIFDHAAKTVLVIGNATDLSGTATDDELLTAYRQTCAKVDQLAERLQRGVADLQLTDIDPSTKPGGAHPPLARTESNFTRAGFEAAVEKVREYINAGDAFQIVLSQRFRTETTARPFDIYRALRVVNPSPFMFYLRAGRATLIGASPEIMCRVENGVITNRPLAGTRPRGATPERDAELAAELVADPKERAEHIMLVDLARNDVGRVAEIGSVKIGDLLTVERYSHVMHLSSTVTGTLQQGLTAFDALRASLPAGTLSGAPKVRAMEIIDELEPHRRGPYGGAVGYVDFSGNMDTCIALRTMVLLGQTAYVQAGAGLVADSVPASEYEETVNKAMSLLRAIEVAETQL
ncbi:anthranilate synthase component i : Anthranilate synthase component I OS=Planctomyces maris DSM 8797 GN=PM8797T_19864 PE=4 SV=1: Anth_synt_I_N: Chorismate_bind [Gemmataceae bacterium]|nr:anthranilate synthase component i : Anthranilate synthase component I OS=Planctomyces maris DSM 8797 GN=PM8797T_19864 PE=4 SV=1: Anth_synt_I_N: Chorismate_bind [Gemmataceae bacterium]VTT98061.1 anthranilate synthase component i : Anthranilate synthase component I OS=Planctomyces maris DSM 8797 GN=PM8797T_19864 PE=4 SV=1: Anth_synt_I_N: Chorismate_bind [Gemmataceae bacterium]